MRRLKVNSKREAAGCLLRLTHDNIHEAMSLLCLGGCAGGSPVATEELRYGLRLAVICLPADPKLLTPEALKIVGPKAFGFLDLAYKLNAA